MVFFRAFNSAQWNGGIEAHEAALVFHGQGQQIQIGELTVAVDFAVIERRRIQQAQVIWPELMVRGLAEGLQGLDGLIEGRRLWIAGLADDADATVLSEWTTCPSR